MSIGMFFLINFLIFVFAIGLCIGIYNLQLFLWNKSADRNRYNKPEGFAVIIATVVFCCLLFTFSAVGLANKVASAKFYGEYRAFIRTIPVYEKTIDMAGNVKYEVNGQLLNAGEWKLGEKVVDTQVDWRNNIANYNERLGSYLGLLESQPEFFYYFYSPIPEDIGLMEVK
ncbi:hypothetical protein M0R19_05575 [Candidatus Pacearchaeota archaeon]|jgi:hypothetical protein|nr:hypothetical protein [Candidatus Pacearchaeota archaeon]